MKKNIIIFSVFINSLIYLSICIFFSLKIFNRTVIPKNMLLFVIIPAFILIFNIIYAFLICNNKFRFSLLYKIFMLFELIIIFASSIYFVYLEHFLWIIGIFIIFIFYFVRNIYIIKIS